MILLQKKTDNMVENPEKRNRLLALLHMAKKDLCWSERFYRQLLEVNFNMPTAAALSNDDLTRLLNFIMKEWDWRPEWYIQKKRNTSQVKVLKQRITQFIPQIIDGEVRLKGLLKKLCGVDRLEWCDDANKLKGLLAALGNIKRKEAQHNDSF